MEMCAKRRRRRREERPRGERPPPPDAYPTLDLHGETAESAVRRAERWLRERQLERVARVRIVTGRGLHSAGPPVLPGAITDLLSVLKGRVVAASQREPGGGSFLVEILRESQPARAPLAREMDAVRRHDGELRRRAEESLSELGIAPTPELLAAEMRRLASED